MSENHHNETRDNWELRATHPPAPWTPVGECVFDKREREGTPVEVARAFAVDLAFDRGVSHREAWVKWRIEVYHPSDLDTPVLKASVNLLLPQDREAVLDPHYELPPLASPEPFSNSSSISGEGWDITIPDGIRPGKSTRDPAHER